MRDSVLSRAKGNVDKPASTLILFEVDIGMIPHDCIRI
jgi:hypothetical protein